MSRSFLNPGGHKLLTKLSKLSPRLKLMIHFEGWVGAGTHHPTNTVAGRLTTKPLTANKQDIPWRNKLQFLLHSSLRSSFRKKFDNLFLNSITMTNDLPISNPTHIRNTQKMELQPVVHSLSNCEGKERSYSTGKERS